MNGTEATFTMVLLFALRCVLPLAVVMGLGYVMNWLVDRWEAEAAITTNLGTAVSPSTTAHCWAFDQCAEELREDCPGLKQQMVPCWLVRTRTEGRLPDDCLTCPIYVENPTFA